TINNDWQDQNYSLETKHFGKTHSAVNLANCLMETVTQWQLERNDKGPAITTDNASNIFQAVKESGLGQHIGCFAHTINLATQRWLKIPQMNRLLGRVRRVKTYFYKSTSAKSCLKLTQTILDIAQHELLLGVPTRRDSCLNTFKRLTTMICRQKHPTVSLIHPLKDMLLRHLEVTPYDHRLLSDIKTAISSDLKPNYVLKTEK
ncbi:hypothetical protein MAR_033751, partial [Mya arenaria]